MIGHGVSSRSSHSWAAGRTTFSAKPWTQSRMSFWSCESSSEKGGVVVGGGDGVGDLGGVGGGGSGRHLKISSSFGKFLL